MNTFGNNIKISVFGQSHAKAIGVTIEGLPSGFEIDMDKLCAFMKRRAPGNDKMSTTRKEADVPEIVCGLTADNKTCGSALTALIFNSDAHSKDYSDLYFRPRPSHADFPAWKRLGEGFDVRGGGQFSGRMTAPLCIAGGILMQMLEQKGIHIGAHIYSIKDVKDTPFDLVNVKGTQLEELKMRDFPTVDASCAEKMQSVVQEAKQNLDSVGGVVECAVTGLDVGLGEPNFCGVENLISQSVFSIPAVKGIEFGLGFGVSEIYGSQNNDEYYFENDTVKTKTNNSGGICGGMTTGMPVVFRVAFKPTPSIAKEQNTVDLKTGENIKIQIKGRHDPCVVRRAVPCVEAAAAIAISQLVL